MGLVIMMIDDTIQLLLDIQDLIHPVAIYQVGSTTLPYINFTKDTDLLFVVPESAQSSWMKCVHYIKRNKITDIDIHICDVKNILGNHSYPYLIHYAKLLYGEPILQIDIFDPELQEQIIIHWFNTLLQINPLSKIIYHLYTILYFWQHNDYILTTEEKDIINQAHDRSLNDEIRQQLYWQVWLLFWPWAKKIGFHVTDISAPDIRRYIQQNFSQSEW